MLQEIVGQVLVALGVLLIVVAAIGLVRLPDVYNRASAGAKAASLGVVCVLLGVAVLDLRVVSVVTLLVAAALQLFTVPIAGQAIGEAALLSRAPRAPGTRTRGPRTGPGPAGGAG